MNDVPGSSGTGGALATAPSEVAHPPSDAGLSIAEAGRVLGLAPETLRKWQHRYGLGPSRSSTGGHRRYIPADLRRLRRVRDLIARGVPTAEAARQVLQDEAAGLESLTADPTVRRLAAMAAQLDGPGVRHLLDQELARRGVVDTWEHLLRPVLVAAGARAQQSGHGIAVEHVLSHVIQAAFASASGRIAPTPAATPQPIMLACAPDEEHELPLVALAAALAERGIATTLLGARTPPAAPAAAACHDGGLLVVFALLPQHVPECVQDLSPHATIVAAGPGWDPAALPSRVSYVNSLPEAVALFD
jgi:MerR family transcriptional regulator, light-induced transcriptional regulator